MDYSYVALFEAQIFPLLFMSLTISAVYTAPMWRIQITICQESRFYGMVVEVKRFPQPP